VAIKQKIDLDVVVQNTQRIDKLERALGRTQKGALSLGQAAKVAAGAIAAIGVGRAIRSLVQVGQQVESLGLRFKFLFGSAEEGARAFDTLTEFASKVPFSLEQISAASGNLAVVAKDADELKNILEITGNVAAVTGLDFRTTGEQIQRALSGGIASADIFRERGVRALLGFKEGATVSIEETREAFQRVFGKGGEFGSATDEFAETLEGTVSMLQDKLFKFQDVASREFFDVLNSELGDLNEFFDENAETIDEFARAVGSGLSKAIIGTGEALKFLKDNSDLVFMALGAIVGLKIGSLFLSIAASIRTATIAMGTFNLVALANPLVLLAAAVAGVVTVFTMLKDETDRATDGLEDYMDVAEEVVEMTDEEKAAVEELNRVKQEQFRTLQNINAEYKNYRTVLPDITNRERGIAKAIEANIVNYDNLKGANKSFVNTLLQLGETEAEGINRIEAERLERLAELYKTEEISKKELEELKTQITADAIRQRTALEERAAKADQDRYQKVLQGIRDGKLQEIDFDKMSTEQKTEIAKEGFMSILRETASFNKNSFEAFKKVRIAEALINTYKGVTNALSTYPPPFSFIFAATQLAAGMAQVNAIRGQQFQGRERGGPVNPGETFLVGESGPELFRPATSGFIDPDVGFGGGQGATINFNISTVDARDFDELLATRQELIISLVNRGLTERGRARLV